MKQKPYFFSRFGALAPFLLVFLGPIGPYANMGVNPHAVTRLLSPFSPYRTAVMWGGNQIVPKPIFKLFSGFFGVFHGSGGPHIDSRRGQT